MVLVGGLLTITMIGCSSGNTMSSGGATSTQGTTAGTYTVTVTGSHGSIQGSTAVTLTVQ
jgi:hypothetical protein